MRNQYRKHCVTNVAEKDFFVHKSKILRRPGIEPGSTAWKATMLTITPPTLSTAEKYIFDSVWLQAIIWAVRKYVIF